MDQEGNQDEQMEDAEAEQEEDELPMYQEHYNALFSMDFFFSHRMESYKEFTCEFLASMSITSDELDRAELDQGWDGSHNFLGKGREEMVTFRQLGDLFGFTMEREWNIKEEELQRVWATIAEGVLFLKVQGCSDQEPSA
ncbi:unnamed protein product [Microthlaspi erraticum]|uniref:Arabidopsis retrotransposon Orf1 C-terminal domain-containing protein n=1 Tax=Microthlaspi erraticum TaxID=1685480 RepID=A0A6D2L5N3_9BRAS|nr:unnamed protein product [Microthlaspi erraticum]